MPGNTVSPSARASQSRGGSGSGQRPRRAGRVLEHPLQLAHASRDLSPRAAGRRRPRPRSSLLSSSSTLRPSRPWPRPRRAVVRTRRRSTSSAGGRVEQLVQQALRLELAQPLEDHLRDQRGSRPDSPPGSAPASANLDHGRDLGEEPEGDQAAQRQGGAGGVPDRGLARRWSPTARPP